MTVAKGVTLGPYEVLSHIGAGGMGDVWRARDRRIGRDVAIKVLPEAYLPGDDRVRRFEQEARAAGALNHPGLVTIFDVGTVDGAPYIVMELLEGETLRDAIGETPSALPLRKTIDYAVQIASALGVAHEKGIIHRDLKPENIFVTSEGRVKILDFGLAKLASEATERDKTGRHLTSAGMVVGTPGYMSPEQVRAKPLDYRTDIFSFGSVLYEMICGCRAFERDTAVETMTAVLNDEPEPLEAKMPAVPPALDVIVRHCLEKNPRDRFQSARDLAFQLRMLPEFWNSRSDALVAQPKKWRYRVGIAAAVLLALAGTGFVLYRGHVASSPRRTVKYKQLTFGDGVAMSPVLAPDGKSFLYVASGSRKLDIYQQRVDGRTPINLTSDSPADDTSPAYSPDGSQIAFRSEREGGGIFVMGASGESPRRLTDFGYDPSWSPRGGRLVVSTLRCSRPDFHAQDGELWIVDTRSGERRRLFRRTSGGPDVDGVQPSWSPHGERIAFWGISSSGQRDVWTIAPDAPQSAHTAVPVTTDAAIDWNPVWSPDGAYLYFGSDRSGTMNLWRIGIDEKSGTPSGAPEPLSLPAPYSRNYSLSQHGELVYATVSSTHRLLALPFDASSGRTGEPRPLFGGSEDILSFEASPDGQWIAFTTGGVQEDVFLVKSDGTHLRQLTNDAARDRSVTWSPDGKTLYFYSNRDGAYHIWSIHADGSSLAQVTDNGDLRRNGAEGLDSPNASRDGHTLAAHTMRATMLVHLDRPAGQRLEPLDVRLSEPQWSPDGKQLAGTLWELHAIAVYSLQTRRLQKVVEPASTPLWLPDARRIVFFEPRQIGIADLATGHVTRTPFTPPPGVRWDLTDVTHISADGSTLFLRQDAERGDIWIMRFDDKSR